MEPLRAFCFNCDHRGFSLSDWSAHSLPRTLCYCAGPWPLLSVDFPYSFGLFTLICCTLNSTKTVLHSLLPVRVFANRTSLQYPRLTSDTPSLIVGSLVAFAAECQTSPGIAQPPSRLCLLHLFRPIPYRYRTLSMFALLSHAMPPVQLLFVRPAFCLQLPSDSTSR